MTYIFFEKPLRENKRCVKKKMFAFVDFSMHKTQLHCVLLSQDDSCTFERAERCHAKDAKFLRKGSQRNS